LPENALAGNGHAEPPGDIYPERFDERSGSGTIIAFKPKETVCESNATVRPVLAFMNDGWVALQPTPCRDVDEYPAPTGGVFPATFCNMKSW
jgi:hypothetical protein